MSEKEDLIDAENEVEVSEQELLEAFGEALAEEEQELAFLNATEEEEVTEVSDFSAEGTELEAFESAEIEDKEFIEDERILSIIESVLFSTDKPLTVAAIKQAFKGSQVKSAQIRRGLDQLMIEYASANRGVTLEEIAGGYQLRTKPDNVTYLKQMVKSKPFRLSGPALEVLSILAYKQPCIKSEVDQIRGVESGHLMRALMEKHLVSFAGKSELPGKPMLYGTTRRFLEIFGLRNIKELPALSEIDELIPDGIGDVEEKETLGDLTEGLSKTAGQTYSEGEEELLKITDELSQITTSSEFFEQEKRRQKELKERERAQDINDALALGENVEEKDKKWFERYQLEQNQKMQSAQDADFVAAAEVEKAEIQEVEIQEEVVGTRIGQVDVAKLKDDLAIFNEEETQGPKQDLDL